MKESPIFARTYDLLQWLIPATLKFARPHRFVMAEAVQRSAFRLQETLVEAAYAEDPQPVLRRADAALTQLRTYLRLCRDLGLLGAGQYEHVSRLVDEIGRLLGGWRKVQRKEEMR
jgi:23S rRNA-intervening sequence protein